MASEVLFDYAAIDLNQTAVDADEVGRTNPQCGDMRQLDRVIWISDDKIDALGVKEVRDDEFWVPYHIPGRPLMPGVLIIEAAAQLTSILYHRNVDQEKFVGFTRCDEVAFRGQVQPGDTLYLLTKVLSLKPRRFIGAAQAIVNDKLIFEGKITGMTL